MQQLPVLAKPLDKAPPQQNPLRKRCKDLTRLLCSCAAIANCLVVPGGASLKERGLAHAKNRASIGCREFGCSWGRGEILRGFSGKMNLSSYAYLAEGSAEPIRACLRFEFARAYQPESGKPNRQVDNLCFACKYEAKNKSSFDT